MIRVWFARRPVRISSRSSASARSPAAPGRRERITTWSRPSTWCRSACTVQTPAAAIGRAVAAAELAEVAQRNLRDSSMRYARTTIARNTTVYAASHRRSLAGGSAAAPTAPQASWA